jgi:hypothetical protein
VTASKRLPRKGSSHGPERRLQCMSESAAKAMYPVRPGREVLLLVSLRNHLLPMSEVSTEMVHHLQSAEALECVQYIVIPLAWLRLGHAIRCWGGRLDGRCGHTPLSSQFDLAL